jgi:hypothetical protein
VSVGIDSLRISASVQYSMSCQPFLVVSRSSSAIDKNSTDDPIDDQVDDTLLQSERGEWIILGMSDSRRAGMFRHSTQRDTLMATATKTPGKSEFIKQVLDKDPFANFKAVNDAWTAAGNDGSISQALVNKLRSEAGLSGNLRTKGKAPAKGVSGAVAPARKGKKRGRKAKVRARDQGKTLFVKEYLHDHPEGNVKAVNAAWTSAGFDGSISGTLVNKMRSQLGLTGNLRGRPRSSAGPKSYSGKRRGRKPKGLANQTSNGAGTFRSPRGRTPKLEELEADIDRLVFKVMGIGDLPDVEESLRQVRRKLYGRLTRG